MLAELKSRYQECPDSIEANQAIAEYYLNADMEDEAEPHLIKILDVDENIVSVHNQLGAIYFNRSQYNDAEYHFKKALSVDFNMAEAHFNLAFLYQTQEKFTEALAHYKEAANINESDPEIYRLMGQCAQSAGMFQEAEAFFVESFRLASTRDTALDLSILYITQEKYPEAEEILTFLLDLMESETEKSSSQDIRPVTTKYSDEQSSALNLDEESLNFALGLVLAKQGRYMNAIKRLRKAVMIDNRNEQAFNYLGECCAAIGLDKEAESFLAKASKLDTQYLLPIINLGKLYYDQGQYQKAISAMEQYRATRDELANVQKTNPEGEQDREAELMYELLGMAYREIGDKAKALEVWRESLEANPDQPGIVSLIDGSPSPIYQKTTLSIED